MVLQRRQKQGILDVLAEMNDNTKINIELQIKHYAYWDRRQLFYLAKLYTEDMKSGEDYALLKKCVSISILDFNLTSRKEYHHVYCLRDGQGYVFSDVLEIHILELTKLKRREYPETELLNWARFFNAEKKEEFEMAAGTSQYIERAYERLNVLSADEEKRLEYEAREKAIRDHNYLMTTNLELGRKKGFEQGKKQGWKRDAGKVWRKVWRKA